MSLEDDLLALERRLWTEGPDAYRENLDPECLVAFTGHAGVMPREQIAGSVGDGPRWRDLEIEPRGLVRPADDVALVTYRARAVRGAEGESYRALVSSAYARRDGGWRMVFHQQTPLAEG